MGAQHFLDTTLLPDAIRPGVMHEVEIYEQGGHRYLKVTMAAPTGADQAYCKDGTPYTASITASMLLEPNALDAIEEGIADARRRIRP